MRDAQIGTELAAACLMRQRRADWSDRRRDALGDHRRADHRRHDEHVVAYANVAVGTCVAEEFERARHNVNQRICG